MLPESTADQRSAPPTAAWQQEISTSLDKVLMRHQSKELKTEARFQYACTFLWREILNFLILEWGKNHQKDRIKKQNTIWSQT